MANIDTALKAAIMNCIGPENCKKCKYRNVPGLKIRCKTMLLRDALLELLLKCKEPVNPVFVGNDEWQCPECEAVVGWTELECGGITETKYKYCQECGRMIAWE